MGWEAMDMKGNIESLRDGAEAVMTAGWPASFIMMYDETWEVLEAVRMLLLRTTGSSPLIITLASCPSRGPVTTVTPILTLTLTMFITGTDYNMDKIVICVNSGGKFDWKPGLPHRDRPGPTRS